MPIKKYSEENSLALWLAKNTIWLPFKIVGGATKLSVKAVRMFLRRRGHYNVGISQDGDSIWVRKYEDME